MVASRPSPAQNGQENYHYDVVPKAQTYVQKDAVLKPHLDRAALVYLELANLAVNVRWGFLLVHVLWHGRWRFCIG
jgi:hypothetical protein